jgi:ribosome-binding protein aMBF1 (putative translation factor)
MAGMAQSDISAIENGWRKPYPAQAARLAKVLSVKASALVEAANEK